MRNWTEVGEIFPLSLGERAGPVAKQWEGEGDQVRQLNHLLPLTFPRVPRGPLPLPDGARKS